ncbi:MAG: hypothetical protein AB8G22_07260 [Saprospiraceae bacterium]
MLKFLKIVIGSFFSLIALYLFFIIIMAFVYPPISCQSENPVFQEFAFDTKEYQRELIKLLKTSDLSNTYFYFGKYVDPQHIMIQVQNENICAEALVTVRRMEGKGQFMNHLMEKKAVSYGGPLLGVVFAYQDDVDNPEIVLTSVSRIVD